MQGAASSTAANVCGRILSRLQGLRRRVRDSAGCRTGGQGSGVSQWARLWVGHGSYLVEACLVGTCIWHQRRSPTSWSRPGPAW